MREAKFFLVVRFSIAPQAEAQVLAWLDGGHVAEVLGQKGFLWCYGNAALKAKFARERAQVEKSYAA